MLDVSRASFERQLDLLADGVSIVPLADLVERLRGGGALDGFGAITFDDGYAEIFEVAFPILRRRGVPATVFLVSQFIDKRRPLWNDRLDAYLEAGASSGLAAGGALLKRAALDAPREDRDLYLQLRDWLAALTDDAREAALDDVGAPAPAVCEPLDWPKIETMRRSGIDFGAHSEAHPSLVAVDSATLSQEVRGSAASLAAHTGKLPALFAYPFGEVDWRVRQVVRNAGFSGAVGVQPGLVRATTDPFQLPRLLMTDTSEPWLAATLQVPAIRARRGRSSEHTPGELEARRINSDVFCEHYFGHLGWRATRHRYDRGSARAGAAALMRTTARSPRTALRSIGELAAWAGPAVGGPTLSATIGQANLTAREFVAEHFALPDRWRYHPLLNPQDSAVRQARLDWLRERRSEPTAPALGSGRWGVETLPAGVLAGSHAVEHHQGREFRWSALVFVLRVKPEACERLLRINTWGIRSLETGYVRAVFVDGRRVPQSAIRCDGAWIQVELGPTSERRRRPLHIAFVLAPLEPRRRVAKDPRRLGMPIGEIELRSEA
jgi:peptidoglycan/xylan/chitin deacetylase (PgdA/CDA1 family)